MSLKLIKFEDTLYFIKKWWLYIIIFLKGHSFFVSSILVEVRSQLRGIGRSQDIEAPKFVSTVGTGIGQQVDTLGFPIPDGK